MPRRALALVVTFVLAGCGSGTHPSSSTTSGSHGAAGTTGTHARTARRTVQALLPPANPPSRTVEVPVLTYHRVHAMPAVGIPDLIVDPVTFVAELDALQSGGYHTVTQAELFDALYRGAPLPAKPVMITVDDGYLDDIRTVLPALEQRHMVATFFVITGRTSEPGFLTVAQIRTIDRAGMDVGDHTEHHVDLRLLTPAQLRSETAGSRRALETILGHPVYAFAYPFGAYNDAVVQAVRAAGFTLAYSTVGGSRESTTAPLTMPRIHVGRAETPSGVLGLLAGG